MVNVPIPYEDEIVGFSILKDIVCPLFIEGDAVFADKLIHSPLSIQYSDAFRDKVTVNSFSNASIVKYSFE